MESDKAPRDLGVRTDTCSFCKKHNAIYSTDPEGEVRFTFREPHRVARYRFGTKTADFLLCTTCGVFVAATMPEESIAVVNVNVLDARAAFLESAVVVSDLDAETIEERLARRKKRWTPVRSVTLSPC